MPVRSARLWLCFGLAAPAYAQPLAAVPDPAPAPAPAAAPPTAPAPAAAPPTAAPSGTRDCVGTVTGFGDGRDRVEVKCDDGQTLSAFTGTTMLPDNLAIGTHGTLTCTHATGSSLCTMNQFVDTSGVVYTPAASCFLTTAVTRARGEPDDGPTLTALRRFRDGPLAGHPDVDEYRRIAPAIVHFVEARADAAQIWRVVDEDYLRPILADVHAGRNADAHAGYRNLVRDLQAVMSRIG